MEIKYFCRDCEFVCEDGFDAKEHVVSEGHRVAEVEMLPVSELGQHEG